MKKKIIFLSAFTLILQLSIAQNSGKLTVQVEGIEKPTSGELYIFLFDDPENFPGDVANAAQSAKVKATKAGSTYTFSNVTLGDYVIMAFQDRNKNGEMDRNLIGFPKEPIAVSKMRRLGKPSFSRNKIAFVKSGQVVNVTLRNQ
ncbi:MAG: DUF2141 domain-containing protein [Bacteroidota bacterium]